MGIAATLGGVRVTSKGQVTIPKDVRDRLGIEPGSQVDFVIDAAGVHLIRVSEDEAAEIVARMRGSARGVFSMSTEGLMALTRGGHWADEA